MPILRINGLCKQFGSFTAVQDVSFEITAGDIFGLLGPNGSGKSTIIRMICGLLRPTAGEIELDGIDVVSQPDAVKRRIGYMSQRFSLYRDLSVWENLNFYAQIYGLSGRHLAERREWVIELVGISEYLDRLASHLSGGWQQRLALACCLMHEPRMVFLDEPTAGIDPVARRQLWDLLFQLSGQGTTFLVTTHYMDEAERCSEIGYLFHSRLIVRGNPDELIELPDVRPEDARWVEVECTPASRGYVALRDTAGVRRATIFGRALHLLVDKNVAHEELTARLHEADVDVTRILDVEASLEDVFVSLTEKHAGQAAARRDGRD